MQRQRRVRILLADDHPLVRSGIRRVLETQPRFDIVGEAAEGDEALARLEELAPDVLILDLAMPGSGGLEVLRHARSIRPSIRIVVLTMHDDPEYVQEAIRLGADGYLLKESAATELLAAIDAVLAGQAFHSPRIQAELAELLRSNAPRPVRAIDRLTDREREILREIAAGRTTKEVAVRLGIGRRTVETHRANLMRKLGLHSVALLTRFAIREGLTKVGR